MRRRDLRYACCCTAVPQVRPEADAVYATLVALMFAALERVAASDAKHGDRLRGENYAYFVEVRVYVYSCWCASNWTCPCVMLV